MASPTGFHIPDYLRSGAHINEPIPEPLLPLPPLPPDFFNPEWPGLLPLLGGASSKVGEIVSPVGEAFNRFLFGRQTPQASPPAPPSAPSESDPILAALAGSAGAAPASFSFAGKAPPSTAAMRGVTERIKGVKAPKRKLPEEPEFSQEDLLNAVLSGLAQGGAALPSGAPRSDMWWNLGLGALAGLAGEKASQRKAKREFKRERVDLENQAAQSKLENDLAILQALAGATGAETEAEFRRAGMLQPKISGDAVLMPREQGGQIQYDVKQLPNQKAQQLQLTMLSAMNDIPTLFKTLALTSPAALDDAAKKVGIESQMLRGVGLGEKTVDTVTQARIINFIKSANPQAFQALQQQAAQMAISESLMRR